MRMRPEFSREDTECAYEGKVMHQSSRVSDDLNSRQSFVVA